MMEYGEKKKDKICTKVFKLFLSIYEDMIGDIVVKYLPFGGIYLFGNITNQYV